MESFDWALVCQQIKVGDKKGLEALFQYAYAGLVRYARSCLGAAMIDAEDVAQEAMIRLWQYRERLDENRSLQALLFVMARNLALNRLRGYRTMLSVEAPELRLAETLQEQACSMELSELLEQWLKELPARRREAFWLSRFENLTYAEIAEVMEISTKTVEHHIVEALRFLRDKIKGYDPQLLLV